MAEAETMQEQEPEADKPMDAEAWCEMIKDAEKVFENWHQRCDNISKAYASLKSLAAESKEREMSLFWANIEVMKPTIYARAPQPVVVPRFNNRKPVPRAASELVERSLMSSFDIEDFHSTMLCIRDDLVLFGRGAPPWIRYKTEGQIVGPDGDPNTDQEAESAEAENVEGFEEYVCYDHVNRRDFLHEPGRKWKEVGWVARGSWLTRKQGKKRFGANWKEIEYSLKNDTDDEYKIDKKARVWEIWHKDSEKVVWVHPHSKDVLDERDAWLDLEGFFPCGQPAYGTCEPESLIPVPDFLFYKDQIEEVNEYTARISALAEALRLKGFYSGGAEDVASAIETAMASTDNNMILIPVPATAALGQGLKDAIVWIPLADVASTITALITLRKEVIEDIYQISGISDIMRGETQASETLGAQNLKAQFGSVRVKGRQNEMIRVADEAMKIAGEIMSENFQPETLMAMGQVEKIVPMAQIQQVEQMKQQQAAMMQQMQAQQQQPPQPGQPPMPPQAPQQPPQMPPIPELPRDAVALEEVMQLLRNERMRPYVLRTASDSTIQPNEDMEKQRRNEFAQAVGGLLTQAMPLVQAAPQAGILVGRILQFVTSAYRAGRELEGDIDDFVEQMEQQAKTPPEPAPDPAMIKAEADAKAKEMDGQIKMQAAQMKQQSDAQKAQSDGQLAMLQGQMKQQEADNKMRELQMKSQHEQRMADMDERLKGMDIMLAQLRIKEAQEKPKPAPNGSANR
jgi:hypothetical protein